MLSPYREEISQAKLNELRGMKQRGRQDDSLYHDYETDQQKQKRLDKEAKELAKVCYLLPLPGIHTLCLYSNHFQFGLNDVACR